MSAPQSNILIFDSGVGGLSIASHIHQLLPAAKLTYLADNAWFPYGLLKDRVLIDRVCLLIGQAVAEHHPKLIVIACNSASTLVLPALRQMTGIPVVGVVPAIKPAASLSSSKVIGLLATPGTIQRDYTDELIGDFAKDCEIIRVGSSELVLLVEQKLAGITPSPSRLKEIMAQFQQHPQGQHMDTLVLACTHFPLIKNELASIAPQILHWVDSGEAIARRVQSLMPAIQPDVSKQSSWQAMFTDRSKISLPLTAYLNELGFRDVRQL
jgi:glutamate racemase